MRQKRSLFCILLAAIMVCGLSISSPVFAESVLKIGTLSNDANQLDPYVSTKSQDMIEGFLCLMGGTLWDNLRLKNLKSTIVTLK